MTSSISDDYSIQIRVNGVEQTLSSCDEFWTWKDTHTVTLDEFTPFRDQLLVIWHASRGNGWIDPGYGPMPGLLKLQINTIQDSNGRKWEAQIDGTGTLDAHTSCVHSWNLAYTGPAGNRMRVTIKSA